MYRCVRYFRILDTVYISKCICVQVFLVRINICMYVYKVDCQSGISNDICVQVFLVRINVCMYVYKVDCQSGISNNVSMVYAQPWR